MKCPEIARKCPAATSAIRLSDLPQPHRAADNEAAAYRVPRVGGAAAAAPPPPLLRGRCSAGGAISGHFI